MSSHIEIWNLLNKVKVSAVTQAQLNEMTSRVAVDKDAVEFWSGMITVARAIGESRTFAHGLPIYNTGQVYATALDDGAAYKFQPTGTEIWMVNNIDPQGCSVALRDESGTATEDNMSLLQADGSGVLQIQAPIYLTNTMSIFFTNGTGSPKTPTMSFYKVSL